MHADGGNFSKFIEIIQIVESLRGTTRLVQIGNGKDETGRNSQKSSYISRKVPARHIFSGRAGNEVVHLGCGAHWWNERDLGVRRVYTLTNVTAVHATEGL
jgi:hypothetical protein